MSLPTSLAAWRHCYGQEDLSQNELVNIFFLCKISKLLKNVFGCCKRVYQPHWQARRHFSEWMDCQFLVLQVLQNPEEYLWCCKWVYQPHWQPRDIVMDQEDLSKNELINIFFLCKLLKNVFGCHKWVYQSCWQAWRHCYGLEDFFQNE